MLELKELLSNWQLERVDEQIYSVKLRNIWKQISPYSEKEVDCGQFNFNSKELVLEVKSNVLMSLLEFQKIQLLNSINLELQKVNFDKLNKIRFRLKPC